MDKLTDLKPGDILRWGPDEDGEGTFEVLSSADDAGLYFAAVNALVLSSTLDWAVEGDIQTLCVSPPCNHPWSLQSSIEEHPEIDGWYPV